VISIAGMRAVLVMSPPDIGAYDMETPVAARV
jgi:hypothetical protein